MQIQIQLEGRALYRLNISLCRNSHLGPYEATMPVCFSLDAHLEYTSCRDLHPPELGCTLSATSSRAEGAGGMHSPEVTPMYNRVNIKQWPGSRKSLRQDSRTPGPPIVIGGVVGGSHD